MQAKNQPKKQLQRQKAEQPGAAFDSAIRACLFTVLAAVPAVFSPWFRGGHELFFPIKIFFTQMPLIIALAILIIKSIVTGEFRWSKTPLNLPVLAVLAAGAVSVIASMDRLISLADLYRIFFYVLFFFLFANFVRTKKEMTLALIILSVAFSAVNFYGLLQRFQIDMLAPAGGRTGVDSTLGNPDFYAGYLVALIPVILVFISVARREWRSVLGILVVMGVAFLFMTQSRAGFLGFVFSLLLFMFFILISGELKKTVKTWIISISAAAVVIMIALSFVTGTTMSRIRESANLKITNIRFRLLCYKSTANILKDHPLTGTGTGTFYNVYPGYRVPEMKEVFTFVETPRYAHNDFLQIGSETGLVGLAAFAWMLFVFFAEGIRILKASKDTFWKWLATGAMCSLGGILVQMVFDFPFYRPETTLAFWLMPAIIAVMPQRLRAQALQDPGKDPGQDKAARQAQGAEDTVILRLPKGWLKVAAPAVGAAVLIPFMTVFTLDPFLGNIHYNRGVRLERSYERTQDVNQKRIYVSAAIKEYRKAIQKEKLNDIYYTKVGTFCGNLGRELWITEQEKKEYMQAAVDNFDKALALCPYYAGYYYNSGQSYLFYGMAYDNKFIERSEERLKKAIALSSYSEAELFHNQLGLLYKERGMVDKAIQEYEEALKINPKTIQSLINLGNAYYAKGMYDRAIEIYFRALEVDSNNVDAFNNLANAYYQKRMFPKAIETYKKAIASNPGYVDAYNNLGSVYYVARMYPEAKAQFQKTLEIAPANSPQAGYARSLLSRIP